MYSTQLAAYPEMCVSLFSTRGCRFLSQAEGAVSRASHAGLVAILAPLAVVFSLELLMFASTFVWERVLHRSVKDTLAPKIAYIQSVVDVMRKTGRPPFVPWTRMEKKQR